MQGLKRRSRVACVVVGGACLALLGGRVGQAKQGGTEYDGGGSTFVAKPEIAKVSCLRSCASRKRARPGATVKVTGSGLGAVRKLVFLGSYGKGDDVSAKVRPGSSTRIQAKVPVGAVSGPVTAQVSSSLRSAKSKSLAILPAPPPEPNATLSPVPGPRAAGAPRIETGTSRTKVYSGGRRVRFSYRLTAGAPVNVTIQLVRAADNAVAATWQVGSVPAGEIRSLTFNGKVPGGNAGAGRYAFRLTAAGPDGAIARSSALGDITRDSFDLYDHIFPVRGSHNYGGANADFGSGRSGHSHQGQDVFARCGKPMVAARGGRVRYSGYQGSAGNYIVIRGSGTKQDYAYMHLSEPSPFRKGDKVYTGQRIGSVGETGNAQGCHLHFELWSAPGWYDGGKPFNPLPALKSWDAYS